MKKKTTTKKMPKTELHWEEGSGNVFADLGFENADEMLAKAKLALCINQLLQKRKLKQTQAANLLGVDQAKISQLNRGRLSGFSIERLVRFLNKLNQDVDLVVRPAKKSSIHQGTVHVMMG